MQERLRARGRFVKLPQAAVSSARGFVRNGPLRQQLLNVLLVAAFRAGVPPARLVALYEGRRGGRGGRACPRRRHPIAAARSS